MNASDATAAYAARLADRAGTVALCLDFDGTLVDGPEGLQEFLTRLAA